MTQHTVYAPITPAQIDGLAGWIVSLRPGQPRWTKTKVRAAIETCILQRTDDAELLCRAITAAARRPNIVEPGDITSNGPHWDTATLVTPADPRKAPRCLTCNGPAHPDDVPHVLPAADRPTPDRIREIRQTGGTSTP